MLGNNNTRTVRQAVRRKAWIASHIALTLKRTRKGGKIITLIHTALLLSIRLYFLCFPSPSKSTRKMPKIYSEHKNRSLAIDGQAVKNNAFLHVSFLVFLVLSYPLCLGCCASPPYPSSHHYSVWIHSSFTIDISWVSNQGRNDKRTERKLPCKLSLFIFPKQFSAL